MAKRETPEINAASMADIAFLLLIFFLVATTMDIDTGLSRKLPAMPESDKVDDNSEIKERNVFVVLIDQHDRLMVEGRQMDIRQLRDKAKEFIANSENKENLPEKVEKEIPFFGRVMVSKGIISLQNDNGTTYGMYIKVQNELAAAYNELRNELAQSKFGKKYDELIDQQKSAIRKVFPQVISEAEPKNIGG
ncbi:MAG: biopolymer transporter ExbD [Bacteroidales bacterium]|jgi:biopolymer transport protein ExbD|nr:biopolymer transporter ExbD [Bacteroidales bacterium]